jgi:hypothetical protein
MVLIFIFSPSAIHKTTHHSGNNHGGTQIFNGTDMMVVVTKPTEYVFYMLLEEP